MDNGPRKVFPPTLKAKVGLAALKGDKTIAEISSLYGVHPTQIKQWKDILQQGMPDLFTDKRRRHEQTQEELIDSLYKQVGKKEIEVEWLKKKIEQFGK
jgi:transposase-like protein